MYLGDRYELHRHEQIGHSNILVVYRGIDMHTSKQVAIGLLGDGYNRDPKFVTRLQRVAKAASSLQHPNIVQVYDYGQRDDGGYYFIVMEMVEGLDLRHYLRQRGVLEVEKAVVIAHDVAAGLGYMHEKGIAHGCLDLNKILIGRDGMVKLIGFCMGVMRYYAPEQGQGIRSPAIDVYLLGNVMYEMLVGHAVFDGATELEITMQHMHNKPAPPNSFREGIPKALEAIIMKCLEKEPDKRFRNGTELAKALE